VCIERLLQGILPFDNVFNESKQASLCVVPGISAQLFTCRIQRFDNQANAKVKVTLGTVKSSNDQIDYAQVQAQLSRLILIV